MHLQINVLGRFSVLRDGLEVPSREYGGRLAQELIRILVARPGTEVSRSRLAEALWGDHPPTDPNANLNVLVNRARRALGDAQLIRTVADGYMFAGPPSMIDAHAFVSTVDAARERATDDPAGALALIDEALGRWGEPWPSDAYTDWARAPRDRLERAYLEALEIGAEAALRLGENRRAVALAKDAVSAAPLREAAHLLLIRALAADGDQAAALAAYDTLRHSLADELGIDPSPAAGAVHRQLLRGELTTLLNRFAPRTVAVPFVGRDGELKALLELDRIALVAGPAGAGKSRLLAQLADRTSVPVIAGRAVLPERNAPWSLIKILLRAVVQAGADPVALLPPRSVAALADLLPEISAPAAGPVDAQTWRALALEGSVRLLAASEPALVIVDDLQWADETSLTALATLAVRADIRMIMAYRPEEFRAQQFLADLRAVHRPLEIILGPLPDQAIAQLAGDPGLAALLAAETDRTPFAIIEALRAMRDEPGDDPLERARRAVQAGRRRSILGRAERQSASARELLGLLAILGRPAPAALLADAMGNRAEAMSADLDALSRAELVRHGELGFTVGHDLVGETVTDALDPVSRARLHRLVARALESHPAAPGERARHLAGAGDIPAAVRCYIDAARARADRFADREAERLATAGLALAAADEAHAELLEVRAETRFRAGDLSGAESDLRSALRLADGPLMRSRLLNRLAALASGSDDLVRATNLADLALTEAGTDPAARARSLVTSAIIDMNLGRSALAHDRYAEALTVFRDIGDARGVADVRDAQAMADFLDGEIATAIDEFKESAALFEDLGNLLRVVTPRSTRGHALIFARHAIDGLADIELALELCRSLGYAEGTAMTLWHRAEALAALDRCADALAAAEDAVALAQGIGHRGWTATAFRGLGIAREAGGDLVGAETAFRQSLATSAHLPLFASWANARLAIVLTKTDRLAEAADHVRQSLSTGPPLAHYEARLAQCELAVAGRDSNAAELILAATEQAAAGGHWQSHARLRELGALLS